MLGSYAKSLLPWIRCILIIALILCMSAQATIITVRPGSSIQRAIDTAKPGDIIEVYSGRYYENINITKQLILRGRGRPVIDAAGKGNAVTLYADGIRLEGFEETSSSLWPVDGIAVASRNNIIIDNIINGCFYGLEICSSTGNIIESNIARGNLIGMRLMHSKANTIKSNDFYNNWFGLVLYHSGQNVVQACNASYNRVFGMICLSSDANIIRQNLAMGNYIGIRIFSSSRNAIDNNTAILSSKAGIFLSRSDNNTLNRNNFTNNDEFDSYDSGTDRWDNRTISRYNRRSSQSEGDKGSDLQGRGWTPWGVDPKNVF